MANPDPPKYSPQDITVCEGLEAVRKRPEMYLGPEPAITDLVFEAACLALTETHCGTCTNINVTVKGTKFSVADDGVGISLAPGKDGTPFAQLAMTVLYACRDHKEHELMKQQLCREGLAAVNAVSLTASVVSSDGRKTFRQEYIAGLPHSPFEDIGELWKQGTTLTFDIDSSYLAEPLFDEAKFRGRIAELEGNFAHLSLAIDVGER